MTYDIPKHENLFCSRALPTRTRLLNNSYDVVFFYSDKLNMPIIYGSIFRTEFKYAFNLNIPYLDVYENIKDLPFSVSVMNISI